MFVNIYVYSKNSVSLNLFLNFFFKVCKNKRIKAHFFLTQHSKIKVAKKFTVLKSPHVNKCAQEQFEFCVYKKQISIYSFQSLKILVILKKIQFKLFADVNIKIQFVLNSTKFKKETQKNFNPNKIFLKKICEDKSKTKIYLKLLDIFGETNFKNCRIKL